MDAIDLDNILRGSSIVLTNKLVLTFFELVYIVVLWGISSTIRVEIQHGERYLDKRHVASFKRAPFVEFKDMFTLCLLDDYCD